MKTPSIGRIVIFKHAQTRYETEFWECPAIISEISERGEVDLIVLSTRIGVVPRKNVKQGNKIGEWSWPQCD